MSSQLTDVEAKSLLDQSNRRARLLKTVQGTFLGYLSSYLILGNLGGLGALMLISILARAIGKGEYLIPTILSLALISTVIVPIYVVNRRVDALAALLREDGILRDTPPGVKHLEKL